MKKILFNNESLKSQKISPLINVQPYSMKHKTIYRLLSDTGPIRNFQQQTDENTYHSQ